MQIQGIAIAQFSRRHTPQAHPRGAGRVGSESVAAGVTMMVKEDDVLEWQPAAGNLELGADAGGLGRVCPPHDRGPGRTLRLVRRGLDRRLESLRSRGLSHTTSPCQQTTIIDSRAATG